jgi:hypothetical protein
MTNEQKAAMLECEAKWKEKIAHIAAQAAAVAWVDEQEGI